MTEIFVFVKRNVKSVIFQPIGWLPAVGGKLPVRGKHKKNVFARSDSDAAIRRAENVRAMFLFWTAAPADAGSQRRFLCCFRAGVSFCEEQVFDDFAGDDQADDGRDE